MPSSVHALTKGMMVDVLCYKLLCPTVRRVRWAWLLLSICHMVVIVIHILESIFEILFQFILYSKSYVKFEFIFKVSKSEKLGMQQA